MSSSLSIRDYRKQDYPKIQQLWEKTGMGNSQRSDDDKVIDRTLKTGGKLLILENKDHAEIIGTSWLTCDGRRIYLHHFGILPEYQGKGYSKLLLKSSLDFASSVGMQIKIEVHKTNKKAIDLYQKGGFKYLGDYDVFIIRDVNSI